MPAPPTLAILSRAMPDQEQTVDVSLGETPDGPKPGRPGVVVIFSGARPRCTALALRGGALEIGRGEVGDAVLDDARLSRRHGRLSHAAGHWTIEDLGSRNGTWADGLPVTAAVTLAAPRVVRMGDTLLLPVADVTPFAGHQPAAGDGPVAGPTLLRAWQSIARLARVVEALHITGESGAGKELAARTFHDAGPRSTGPFVAVNCAAIPEGLAERLLFGARKGAYSGAASDVDGYLQAAHGGTLFLDEVSELELTVQAKLLRVLETHQVMALGATRSQAVDLRIVSATHRDLRAQVAAGRMREDLYFRLGRPCVALPPLRSRGDEMPWLVERAVRRALPEAGVHVTLVEACLLREWPGNVRELFAEIQAAVQEAHGEGRTVIEGRHLPASAGRAFERASRTAVAEPGEAAEKLPAGRTARVSRPPPPAEEIIAALQQERGNTSRTARALGLHRTQLRRLFERHGIDPRRYGVDH
jgi:DNA-binding NtrC family response regulator